MTRVPAQSRPKKKEREKPVCPKCGTEIKVGDWPWCPHSKIKPERYLWNWVK